MTSDEILDELGRLQEELSGLHITLAGQFIEQERAYTTTIHNELHSGSAITFAKEMARVAAFVHAEGSEMTRGDIKAAEERRDHLRILLAHTE